MHTYRAARFFGSGKVTCLPQIIPRLEPHQIRVRVTQCGVCASNVPVWEGRPWFTYPLAAGAPGHEASGTIEEIGAEVEHFQPGDRVAYLGTEGFAEYETVSATTALKLPANTPAEFLGEPMACAMNILRRARIVTGETVALVGFGFLGRLLLPLLLAHGARVVVLTHQEEGRASALQAGAIAPACAAPEQWISGVRELIGPDLCDVVIETAGTQAALTLGGELTRIRGRLIIAGYHQDGPRQVNMQLWNWRGLDVINAHERDPMVYLEGMRLALAAVADGRWSLAGLISHRFPLEDLSSALAAAARRDRGFIKAVISL